jgi:nucleotide-binding universal stress UspA family protein
MIPPKRLLVGIDFSEPSRTALAFAARLAFHAGAHLDVLHVLDPLLIAAARSANIDLRAESADELSRFIDDTRLADACHPEQFVICGTPGVVLCNIAAREQADVVIVGAHGMSGAARWLFGPNTERVLRHAAMSVLVVPTEWRPTAAARADLFGVGPVIAAVDFTQPALAAACAAARLANFLQTRLTVLHVVPEVHVLDRWTSHASRLMAEAADAARRELDLRLSRIKTIAPTDVNVVTGDIVDSILRTAEPTGAYAPLLVLGRRPHLAGEAAPGAVVSRALASLRVPMLVVDPDEGESHA